MLQMFSFGERTELQVGQFNTWTLLLWSHACCIDAVWSLALSCWNTQGLPWRGGEAWFPCLLLMHFKDPNITGIHYRFSNKTFSRFSDFFFFLTMPISNTVNSNDARNVVYILHATIYFRRVAVFVILNQTIIMRLEPGPLNSFKLGMPHFQRLNVCIDVKLQIKNTLIWSYI